MDKLHKRREMFWEPLPWWMLLTLSPALELLLSITTILAVMKNGSKALIGMKAKKS